ncbi:putative polygalacturonase [Arcticibacter svalbardensis MN12-7]|uniref:Putative polygalacturonase n=1 Tax=Arcticibacter svalbardensis MN12-7 TaxID=1150600 RepID=R9GM91_9SPHI|nr:glycosyl hydrolase family 28 protein [Arcticibacter svalbardensis]EOR92811.1 putative polygalacturonase [Arcticibacter svalbardensis MN12-7]
MKYLIFITLFSLSIAAKAQKVYDITAYGAKADEKTNNAVAIQKAIDACSKAGGGIVRVPASSTFITGPFNLKSNIDFHLEAGAVIKASSDENFYKKSVFRSNLGEGTIWIGAENIENLTISGTGKIDGNGISFMGKELSDSYELKPFKIADPRPHVLTIVGGKNIRIHDLHIGNSAYWTIHLVGCNDVVISGISLINSLKVRNSDGIDLDHSKNVRISNCYIESGDDCICLKNRREFEEFGSCENITVTNCTMTSRSCAIKIGSENMDTIKQVLFNNCIIKNSNRGVGIQNRDEGTISDVIFSNMIIESHLFSDVWWGKAEPIYVTAYRRAKGNNKDANWRFPKGSIEGKVGEVKNITFSNIKCTSENGIYVSGESADKISNIRFDNVDLYINKITKLQGGIFDRRPSEVEGFVKGNTSGFYLDNANNITIKSSAVKWGKSLPDYFKYAIDANHVENLDIEGFNGNSAFPSRYNAIKK